MCFHSALILISLPALADGLKPVIALSVNDRSAVNCGQAAGAAICTAAIIELLGLIWRKGLEPKSVSDGKLSLNTIC
jgi:hypothetical protein